MAPSLPVEHVGLALFRRIVLLPLQDTLVEYGKGCYYGYHFFHSFCLIFCHLIYLHKKWQFRALFLLNMRSFCLLCVANTHLDWSFPLRCLLARFGDYRSQWSCQI